MENLALDSSDIGCIEEFVSKIYSKMHIGATGTATRTQISRRTMGADIAFDDLSYSFDIAYAAEPPDVVIICDVISSTIRRDGDRDGAGVGAGPDETFGPGDQFLIGRPEVPYGGLAHAPRLRFTLLNPALLDRTAAGRRDANAPRVRLLDHRPVSRQAKLQLDRSIAYVRNDVMATLDAMNAPLLASMASQHLAATVLNAYANTAGTEATTEDSRDAHTGTLQRAVTYIETNPDLALTLGDIAQAAGVTPRALQLAFRRHLDCAPMAYLRRVRLEHARDELRGLGTGDRHTVTAVASHWGFTTTRFTQQYREVYGEMPLQTLHH